MLDKLAAELAHAIPVYQHSLGTATIATFHLMMLPSGAPNHDISCIGHGVQLASERVVIERLNGVIEQFQSISHMWAILEDRGSRLCETYTMHTRQFPRLSVSYSKKGDTLQLMGTGVQLPSQKIVLEIQRGLTFYSDLQQLQYRYANDVRVVIALDEP